MHTANINGGYRKNITFYKSGDKQYIRLTNKSAHMHIPEEWIYPIGRFKMPESFDKQRIKNATEEIRILPRLLDYCIENLDEAQFGASYREGGWSIQQILHHIADSHMNAYIRIKLAITEEEPVVKPYEQDLWVQTADVLKVPANYSTTLVHALHFRLSTLLESFDEAEWQRCYFHPESQSLVPLWQITELYAWHGRHHSEQIRQLRIRKGW